MYVRETKWIAVYRKTDNTYIPIPWIPTPDELKEQEQSILNGNPKFIEVVSPDLKIGDKVFKPGKLFYRTDLVWAVEAIIANKEFNKHVYWTFDQNQAQLNIDVYRTRLQALLNTQFANWVKKIFNR